MVCLDSFLALPLIKYYRITESISKLQPEPRDAQILTKKMMKIPYTMIIRKASLQYLNIFLIFTLTLTLFPAVQANIKPASGFFLQDMYTLIVCFLSFNVSTVLGSLTGQYIQWPSPKFVVIPVALRFLYIPFYLLSNYQVPGLERVTPVYITWDWLYWIVSITMAYTSGYFSSISMQYISGTVDSVYSETATKFGAAVLVTGLFTGVLTSYLWPYIITTVK
ncbi:equilibrative nucleoside transporter [Holotrichia oblita]|uniref:Equilibrative nucleoside transporter n=1 Tax=Holotrichia oblita TaxID=644536 RepID=A0ACB9SGZ7_HOLOL|nr:equilibrative nucleoside transporter [Holotrichia oblita]